MPRKPTHAHAHEEGLDQAFNSLDAQRAAAENYIKSQVAEGWELISTHYDDGGFSGVKMETLCQRHGITIRYIQKLLRLNFLCPQLKEAILAGTQPRDLKLADLMREMPLLWDEQLERFGS